MAVGPRDADAIVADRVDLLGLDRDPTSFIACMVLGIGYSANPPSNVVTSCAGATASGMLAVEAFDRIWPFEVPPAALLRALLIEDTETVSGLGYTLLAEEDLALCSYVCPAHLDYGRALRRTLDEIKQGR